MNKQSNRWWDQMVW